MSVLEQTTEPESRRRLVTGAAFAFSAAVSYGVAQVLTRHGVSDLAPPLVGSAVALICGTLGLLPFTVRGLWRRGADFQRGALLFAGAGICSSVGVVGLFQSLQLGPVVLVAPVVSTNPLFTLLWAVLLLRNVEHISREVVIGALLVVAGVIVLTIG